MMYHLIEQGAYLIHFSPRFITSPDCAVFGLTLNLVHLTPPPPPP